MEWDFHKSTRCPKDMPLSILGSQSFIVFLQELKYKTTKHMYS